MKKKILLTLLSVFLFPLNLLASESGWLERNGYYKPFVKVKLKNCLVLFVTEKGKVYRGKCRKNRSIVTPGKNFLSNSQKLTYIVLKISDFSYPQVVETGEIGK